MNKPNPISQRISQIVKMKAEANDIRAELRKADDKILEEETKLKKDIRDGNIGTGDRIADFLIVRFGLFRPNRREIEHKLRNLEKQLSQHIGQLVLMIERQLKRVNDKVYLMNSSKPTAGLLPPMPSHYVQESFCLGINKGTLAFDSLGECSICCGLTTDIHAKCDDPSSDRIEIIKGNIFPFFPLDLCLNLGESIAKSPFSPHFDSDGIITSPVIGVAESLIGLEVIVGDKEVNDWFRGRGQQYLSVFCKMEVFIGRVGF